MSTHAKFSPSGADRWAVCTASIEAEQQYEDKSSVYAQAGTDAHDLLERAIKAKTVPSKLEPKHPSAQAVDKCYYHVELYLNDPKYLVLPEAKVRLTEDIYGTADVVIIDLKRGHLEVVDYKNGFTMVEADCRQLQIYLAAAYKSLSFFFEKPIKTFAATIVQPNGQHPEGPVRTEEYTKEALLDSVERIVESVNDIKRGDTKFCASEKGCKFCKHKANCSELADKALEGVRAMFQPVTGHLEVATVQDAHGLTPEQKSSVLEARGLFKAFLAAIEEDALVSPPPGYKVVAGRSNRRFIGTEEEVINFCKATLKLKVSEFTEAKLLGPAKIEKLIDVKARNGKSKLEAFREQVEKPEGKPTVVLESDKRPAMASMFEKVIDPLN